MLVLSRKKDEKIVVKDAAGNVLLTINVCDVVTNKKSVRIGIDAAEEYVVDRMEVHQAKLAKQPETGF